jgi:hypothetical protein
MIVVIRAGTHHLVTVTRAFFVLVADARKEESKDMRIGASHAVLTDQTLHRRFQSGKPRSCLRKAQPQ